MTDDEVVAHIEKALRTYRNPKRTISMVTGIAGMVVALGTAMTYMLTAWTSYGWVTHGEFTKANIANDAKYEARAEYSVDKTLAEQRNDRQDNELKQQEATSNEILAFVKIVPQLKVMIKIKCMGNNGVQYTIDDLKRQFKTLTGRDYQEPLCDDPEIKGVR